MSDRVAEELARFEAGLFDADGFTHAEHVRVAFEMLGRHEFDDALARYAGGLRRMTARLGVPGKFHATVTVAFLALVAERRARTGAATWEAFAGLAPDLLDRACLRRWYPADVLGSDVARRTFVLPPPPVRPASVPLVPTL
jgi:hypothetical protein